MHGHMNVTICRKFVHSFVHSNIITTVTLSHAPHNDVSVNDGAHIRRWCHKIIILYYNPYHCVTTAYSIQYSNMLYMFVA